MNPSINYVPQGVMMCQCGFMGCNTHTHAHDSGRGHYNGEHVLWGPAVYEDSLYHLLNLLRTRNYSKK